MWWAVPRALTGPALPVRRVRADDREPVDAGAWFTRVPAVAQVLRDGWDRAAPERYLRRLDH